MYTHHMLSYQRKEGEGDHYLTKHNHKLIMLAQNSRLMLQKSKLLPHYMYSTLPGIPR